MDRGPVDRAGEPQELGEESNTIVTSQVPPRQMIDEPEMAALAKRDASGQAARQQAAEEQPNAVEQAEPAANGVLSYVPQFDFFVALCRKFDAGFVVLLAVQNLNQGLWHMVLLAAQDYFKQYLKLDPGVMTGYMSLVSITWSIKILYGLISDNFPVAGTKRKSYVIIMGFAQFVSLLSVYAFEISNGLAVAMLLSITSMCIAFINVVVDAIVCVQARRDPEHGSQDLMSLAWIANGIGGVAGCLLGGYMTQYCHPKYSFLIFSIMGLVLALCGLGLSSESELDEHELEERRAGRQGREEQNEGGGLTQLMSKLSTNICHVYQALLMKEIYMVLFFFLANGLLSPSFGQFSYFFMLNVAHISKFQFAMFGVISRACHILGTVFYKSYLKDTETRTIIFYSTAISVVSSFVHLAFAMRWNVQIGVSDIVFIIFTDVVFGCLSLALCVLPSLALFAKITPPGVEATIFAFLTGIWNFSDGVVSPMVGALVNKKLAHVTAADLNNYYKLMIVSFVSSFFGFFILPLIPLQTDIDRYRKERRIKEGDEQESLPNGDGEAESQPLMSGSGTADPLSRKSKDEVVQDTRAESTESVGHADSPSTKDDSASKESSAGDNTEA